ncbi:PRC-barrel domain-containing protein [Prosthecobacter sp.]|uniref:PRC-barrel domain-containing protein n=1 Tax=Prosthecobacter sp. TaxID=1965333 RepID=UPI003783D864
MKLNATSVISGVLALFCAFQQVQSATPARLRTTTLQGKNTTVLRATGEVDGPDSRFAELINIEVRNNQDEKLGRIKAITVDLANSRIVEVLVSSRFGFLGMNERVTPVPPSAFRYDDNHEVARLNVSRAQFAAAPLLGRKDPSSYAQQDRVASSSRYFGVKPWFAYSGNPGAPRLGYVQTTEAIELMQIKNPQGHYLGEVGLLLMDLPSGRITQVVNDTDTMDDTNNHILPLKALRYNDNHTSLVLNETFQQLLRQPHLRWGNSIGSNAHFNEEVSPLLTVPATPVKVASTR